MKKAVIITLLLEFFALVAIANINRKAENKTEKEMEKKIEKSLKRKRNVNDPVCFRSSAQVPLSTQRDLFFPSFLAE